MVNGVNTAARCKSRALNIHMQLANCENSPSILHSFAHLEVSGVFLSGVGSIGGIGGMGLVGGTMTAKNEVSQCVQIII